MQRWVQQLVFDKFSDFLLARSPPKIPLTLENHFNGVKTELSLFLK